MRRRPSLELFLNPPVIFPGDVASTSIRMLSKSDTPCDGLVLDLVGVERRYHRTDGVGETAHRVYHQRDVVRLRASFDGFRLTEGTHERRAQFPIPRDAPPSYESNFTTIRYELAAHVVIPWWPDRFATYRLPVAIPPEVGATPRGATRFTSGAAPIGKDLFIEASLAREDLAIGAKVEGVVSMANVAHHRIRSVQAALVEIETSRVQSSTGPSETRRTTWTIHEGKPQESAEIRFALKIPEAHCPDFVTPFIAVRHELRIVAQIAFGRDIHIAIPIRLHRPRTDVAEVHATPALLGRGKRKSNWGRALADFGATTRVVSLNEETDELVLDHEGRSIHITAEHRGNHGPFLVAEIEWPSLGMDLKVAERSWSDFGRKKGVEELDERFAIEGRDPEQVRRLFDSDTARAILPFRSIGLDDTHAVAASPGSSHAVAALREMVARAILLSDAVVRSASFIPAPQGLTTAASRYREFALRHAARLTPGDFSVRRLLVDGVSMSIEHRFQESTAVASLLIVDVSASEPLVADLKQRAATVTANASVDASGIRVPLSLVEDPSSIEPMMAGLAEVVRSIGVKQKPQGPYR